MLVRSEVHASAELSVLGQIAEIRTVMTEHCPEIVIDSVTRDNFRYIATSVVMEDIVCSDMSPITAVGMIHQLMRLDRILEVIINTQS